MFTHTALCKSKFNFFFSPSNKKKKLILEYFRKGRGHVLTMPRL